MDRDELLKYYPVDVVNAALNICLKIVTDGTITEEEETFINAAIDGIDAINNCRDSIFLLYSKTLTACAKQSTM